MAKPLETIAGRLERVTAQLEQAAKQKQGGGLMSTLWPFALGALVGAGAALLYAPQPGEQTRATLRENADKLQNQAKETASSARARVQGGAQEAPGELQSARAGAQESAQDLIQAIAADGAAKLDPAQPNAAGARAQLRQNRASGRENPS